MTHFHVAWRCRIYGIPSPRVSFTFAGTIDNGQKFEVFTFHAL